MSGGECEDGEAARDGAGEGEEAGVEGPTDGRGHEVGYLGVVGEAFSEGFALCDSERCEVWVCDLEMVFRGNVVVALGIFGKR